MGLSLSPVRLIAEVTVYLTLAQFTIVIYPLHHINIALHKCLFEALGHHHSVVTGHALFNALHLGLVEQNAVGY